MTTTVIFGDVHGDSEKLRFLIQEARGRWGECAFYGVGDYIDRGPDSKGVIQTCVDEGIQGVLGNHELWFARLLSQGHFSTEALHRIMGGRATLESYWGGMGQLEGAPPKAVRRAVETMFLAHVPASHKAFILSLGTFQGVSVAGTTYWLIHAGISATAGRAVWSEVEAQMHRHGLTGEDVPEKVIPETFARANTEEILWNHIYAENPSLYRFPHGGVQVIGHTPLKEAIDGGHFIALDTGCGRKRKPNQLSAVALHDDGTRTLFSV
jgi:hypothetical protein